MGTSQVCMGWSTRPFRFHSQSPLMRQTALGSGFVRDTLAVAMNCGSLCVLRIRALLLGVHMRAPNFGMGRAWLPSGTESEGCFFESLLCMQPHTRSSHRQSSLPSTAFDLGGVHLIPFGTAGHLSQPHLLLSVRCADVVPSPSKK